MPAKALRTSVALAAAVVSAVVALPAAAHAAPTATGAATTVKGDDFNGDGYADVAFTAPSATVNGQAKAGYVAVMYGSATGLKTASKQVFSQDTAGIPGAAEEGDAFGSAVTSEDLDRDGYADLIVGATGENIGTVEDAGILSVVWGGATGLAGGAVLAEGKTLREQVGNMVKAGDFDADGNPDVVSIAQSSDIRLLSGPFGRDGAARATSGTPDTDGDTRFLDTSVGDVNGDGTDDLVAVVNSSEEWDSRTIFYWRGTPEGFAAFARVDRENGYKVEGGEHIAAGDVNKDGYADIVVGRSVDGYDSDVDIPMAKGGMVTYVPGSANGPQGTKAQVFNQDSPGIPGAAENDDAFGSSVSINDVNGDGYGDIAIGAFGEAIGTLTRAGSVIVMRGSATGLTGTGAQGFNQDTPGVTGAAETDDFFGLAVKLVDTNRDARAELLVGAPRENAGEGSVWVLPGTTAGITATGSFNFGAGTLGTVAPGAALGSAFNR
ncbi:FG-GAP-like repeat-containing protein [Streptomyces sp. ISL-100]|uniref:FG-GAP-like repeat-containing protein n=1 Tax=Streptomyces sp. ISL-100 TaxID=2819173 RepID=UPI001BE9AA74|nr:FG-GAP-like repeat-containing protein [Streptomyces sp. ISL-100]MBT2401541.1 VCBS repeat-containing protein [Streptomyces sp. ISL-100]